jgi:hypothetical protein
MVMLPRFCWNSGKPPAADGRELWGDLEAGVWRDALIPVTFRLVKALLLRFTFCQIAVYRSAINDAACPISF